MTFDNGQILGSGNVTEQFVRLIVQAIVTLAVIGGWFYMLSVQSPLAAEVQPLVMTVIGFWFAQGAIGVLGSVLRERATAQIETAKVEQMKAAHTQAIDDQNTSIVTRAARRMGVDR